jgi:two-component system CheB/CheR fusion protein
LAQNVTVAELALSGVVMVSTSEPASGSAEPDPDKSANTEAAQPETGAAGSKQDVPVGGEGPAFPVVGIGASAGGLEALEALTRRLSSDGMAFVVIQHLAPAHESLLRDILARGTSMKVVTVRDAARVERNTIYVTPPNTEIAIGQGFCISCRYPMLCPATPSMLSFEPWLTI